MSKKGFLFWVKESFQDLNKDLILIGDELIFLKRTDHFSFFDRFDGIIDYSEHHFFNIRKNEFLKVIVEGEIDIQEEFLKKHLVFKYHFWPRLNAQDEIAISNQFSINESNSAEIIQYLLDFVEGKKDIENIYYWIHRYQPALIKQLTPKEFLHLKLHPFHSAKIILNKMNIHFNESPVYSWLDYD